MCWCVNSPAVQRMLRLAFSELFVVICTAHICGTILTKKSLDTLRVTYTYNNAMRKLSKERFCSASKLFVDCNVASFKEVLRKYVYSFKTRIMSSVNELVMAVTNSFSVYSSTLVVQCLVCSLSVV